MSKPDTFSGKKSTQEACQGRRRAEREGMDVDAADEAAILFLHARGERLSPAARGGLRRAPSTSVRP